MRVLVTRPEPDATRTAAELAERGHEPVVTPLMVPLYDRAVAIPTADLAAVVMSSANAARAVAGRPEMAELAKVPAFTVGAATARAAEEAGFRSVRSAAGAAGDLAALVAAAVPPGSGTVLYLAGRDRAGDLDGLIAATGRPVRMVEVYRAEVAEALPIEAAAALAGLSAGERLAALVFSRRSAEQLVRRLAELQDPGVPLHLDLACISEAAAEPFRSAGYGRVAVAERPDAQGVYEALDRLGSST